MDSVGCCVGKSENPQLETVPAALTDDVLLECHRVLRCSPLGSIKRMHRFHDLPLTEPPFPRGQGAPSKSYSTVPCHRTVTLTTPSQAREAKDACGMAPFTDATSGGPHDQSLGVGSAGLGGRGGAVSHWRSVSVLQVLEWGFPPVSAHWTPPDRMLRNG